MRLSIHRLADRIVDLIVARERRGKPYGTVVLAEGLAELLPDGGADLEDPVTAVFRGR